MSNLNYSAYGTTDIGKVRDENQDALNIDTKLNLFIVADGMGGVQYGALAARYIVDDIPKLFKENIDQIIEKNPENITNILKEIFNIENDILRKRLGRNTGASVVLTFINGREAFIANQGDSRAYLYNKDLLTRLTRDHNIANLLVENGKITPEQAMTHPMRHRLTSYVGMEGAVVPEVKRIALEPGNRLLLCTDGLTGMIPEREIAEVLKNEQNQKIALKKLIAKANEAGGHDNITIILIDIS